MNSTVHFPPRNPEDIVSAFKIIHHVVENDAYFVSCNEDDSIAYISHVISRSGTYWPQISTVKEGEALLYVIAPPNESMYADGRRLESGGGGSCCILGTAYLHQLRRRHPQG